MTGKDYVGIVDGKGYKACMDEAKLPLELIPPEHSEALARVLMHGMKKYSAHNWMRGMSWTTVYGSVRRHLDGFFAGEDLDADSELPALWHAACGLMFLVYYEWHSERYGQFDDRVFKGPQ